MFTADFRYGLSAVLHCAADVWATKRGGAIWRECDGLTRALDGGNAGTDHKNPSLSPDLWNSMERAVWAPAN
jgi:hypothetical protein